MELPASVKEVIEEELSKCKLKDLENAFASLSHAYRSGEKKTKQLIRNEKERLLYLATRLPATYSAVCQVMEFSQRVVGPINKECTLLDLGSGPGTFLLAALQSQLSLVSATLVERDAAWIPWGEKILACVEPHFSSHWITEDIEKAPITGQYDIVAMSYSLGELLGNARLKIVEKSWEATRGYLFLIEPGTPAGFARVREARDFLLIQGAHLVAPCPHGMSCPMPVEDWCHFSTRLPRTSLHRRIKGGNLGFEDEKFSYVVFSRNPHPLPSARIVRRPQKKSGHVCLQLCHQENFEQEVFSKKQGDLYRTACRKKWGDST